MLSLKNALAKSSPAPSPAGSSMTAGNDPHKNLKRWQLEGGRARKRVEELSSQLDAARQAFAQISRDSVGDERLDITAVTDAMTQAEKKVSALEAALKIALQREQAAEISLNNAEMEVKREARDAACERVLALGPRFEEVSAVVRQFAVDMARETEAMRVAGGNEEYASRVSKIWEQYDFFLRLASHLRTTDFPSALKQYETFTDCLVAVCGVRAPQ